MANSPVKAFRIERPLARDLRAHCKATGIKSESAVIKTALREYLEKQKPKEEVKLK